MCVFIARYHIDHNAGNRSKSTFDPEIGSEIHSQQSMVGHWIYWLDCEVGNYILMIEVSQINRINMIKSELNQMMLRKQIVATWR